MIDVYCVNVGTKYDRDFDRKLKDSVAKHLTLEHTFTCLTHALTDAPSWRSGALARHTIRGGRQGDRRGGGGWVVLKIKDRDKNHPASIKWETHKQA